MTRVGLRGITTRRLRTVLTALAIVLGVAMVSGAYTLTDTMRGAADSLSSSAYDGTAAVVSAKTAFKVDSDYPVPARHSSERARPGSRGSRSGEGRGQHHGRGADRRQGRRRRRHRPVLRRRARPARRRALPLQAEGGAVRDRARARWSSTPARPTARATRSATPSPSRPAGPSRRCAVTGIGTFGDVDSIGTATFALFDLHAAQQLFHKQRQLHRDPRRRARTRSASSSRRRSATRFRSRPRRRTTASRSTA